MRFVVATMSFFALLIAYMLRVNLSLAITGMVNHTAIKIKYGEKNVSASAICPGDDTVEKVKKVRLRVVMTLNQSMKKLFSGWSVRLVPNDAGHCA